MKKILILLSLFLLCGCGYDAAPEHYDTNDTILIQQADDTTVYMVNVIGEIEEDLPECIVQDSTALAQNILEENKIEKLSKKEEAVLIQQTYDTQQINVMRQIEKLELQQVKIDSILKKKKNGGN